MKTCFFDKNEGLHGPFMVKVGGRELEVYLCTDHHYQLKGSGSVDGKDLEREIDDLTHPMDSSTILGC